MQKNNHYEACEDLGLQDYQIESPQLTSTPTQKDLQLRSLQEKNFKLRTEIAKIDQAVQQSRVRQNTSRISVLPQIKSKVSQQELENAYRQIKNYQYQMKKMKFIDQDGGYANQVTKLEKLLKEKQNLSEKLRKQIIVAKKYAHEITKSLKNADQKQENKQKYFRISEQISKLNDKIHEYEQQNTLKLEQKKKQWNYIVKLQNQLLEEGISSEYLRLLKQKVVNKGNNQPITESNIFYSQINKNGIVSKVPAKQEEQIEDRTPQAFVALQNQIKILLKVSKAFDSKLDNLDKQTKQVSKTYQGSSKTLKQIENEIQRLQTQIQLSKAQIDPIKLRPTITVSKQSILTSEKKSSSNNKLQKAPRHSRVHSLRDNSAKMTKSSSIIKPEKIEFNDRLILAEEKTEIISIDLYKDSQFPKIIIGFTTTYRSQNPSTNLIQISHSPIHPQLLNSTTLSLPDPSDHISQIEIFSSGSQKFLQGVQIYSKMGYFGTFGQLKGEKTHFKQIKDGLGMVVCGVLGKGGVQQITIAAADKS